MENIIEKEKQVLNPSNLKRESVIADTPAEVMTQASYLEVTYSAERAPFGPYPLKLSNWLFQNVFKRPGKILDLGCGRGEYLHAFSELGFAVHGVDISPAASDFAKGYPVTTVDMEKTAVPLPPHSFDFVFSKSVIEHMRNPNALFQTSFEKLKPGGKAVIMVPSWEHNYWGPFFIDYTHVTPFTATALNDALLIAGFKDVKVTYFYQLPLLWKWPILKYGARLIAKLPLPFRPFNLDAPWPESLNKVIRFSNEVMLMAVAEKPL